MNRVVYFVLVGLATLVARAPADPPKVSPRAGTLELLLLPGNKPTRLDLKVDVGGQSVPAIWDETFAKLFAFHDCDNDGALDKAEAARLPSAFVLRQVLWGLFTPGGDAPKWDALDLDRDGKVRLDELADFYRRAGLGGVLVGVGKPPGTDRLTDTIVKHLDTNADTKVDEREWKQAPEVLFKLDKNDDELIGPGELVERLAYPGATGGILLAPPSPDSRPDSVTDSLPLVVLPLRTADTHWADVVANRLAQGKQPVPVSEALTDLRKAAPKTAWQVRFGKEKDAVTLEPVGEKAPANERLVFADPTLQLELRADPGKLAGQTTTARKRFTTLFAECDTDGNGILDTKEIGTAKAGQFQQLLAIADRNTDKKLDEKELTAWLDLQEQIAKGHVLLTILDHGTGLFELLDANHDGALSVRELRTAWGRLTSAGCVSSGTFDRVKLPRCLIAVVSRGHPRTMLGEPVREGPEWFRAMDRNGDGDVSRREFVGPADVFAKLDTDKDGLISVAEAGKTAK